MPSVELVAAIAGRPLQYLRQHSADLVDREIKYMRVKLATDVGVAYRSSLGEFTLPSVINTAVSRSNRITGNGRGQP